MAEQTLDIGNREVYTDRDLLRDYLNEAGKTPLLSAEEEVELSKRIETGLYAQALLDTMPEQIEPSVQEELEWLAANGAEARQHFINANLRLVVNLAKKHTGRGLSLLDLIQEGNIGLIRGVEKFDYTQGFKFSTYGTWWIRQQITRGIADSSRTIRIPVHMSEKISAMFRAESAMKKNGDETTPETLALKLGTTAENVLYLKEISRRMISLNDLVGDGDGAELHELIVEDGENESIVTRSEVDRYVHDILEMLTNEEALVVRMRYGFNGRVYTLDEVSKVVRGLTRERIRQIESKAMRKLREYTAKQKLSDILD